MSKSATNSQSGNRLDNLKTINGESLEGPGNIVISGGGGTGVHNDLTDRDAADAHPISAVTGLQSALDGKAATVHGHAISDVTGLQGALNDKQDELVSGTNIKTVNNQSLLGSGNITISGGAGDTNRTVITSPDTITAPGRYFILGSDDVTLPTPVGQDDGFSYDFVCEVGEEPTLVVGTDLIKWSGGLTDSVIMDRQQVELVVNNGLYEV